MDSAPAADLPSAAPLAAASATASVMLGKHHDDHYDASDGAFSVLLVILLAVAAQFGLRQWQARHPRSFRAVTLFGLWLLPLLVSLALAFTRFVCVWTLFTVVTAYLVSRALATPMPRHAPRRIYWWFSVVHKVSYGAALLGYGVLLAALFGVGVLRAAAGTGVLLCFYGMYFGVMCRDAADVACEAVAGKLGYYAPGSAMPRRRLRADICALCDDELGDDALLVLTLPCQHRYHSACLKGWAMVGKKDTCAYCHEKICLKKVLHASAWRSQSMLWAQLLDAVRMIVVWNPLVLVAIDAVLRATGFGIPDHNHT